MVYNVTSSLRLVQFDFGNKSKKPVTPLPQSTTNSPSRRLSEDHALMVEPSFRPNKSSLFFNLLKPTGHVMHQQFNIQQLYALPTLYLCVLYLSEDKQRLVPLTA